MRTGAVAILDALGFKGIWRIHQPGVVLAKMQHAVRRAQTERAADLAGFLEQISIEFHFLSDTVVAVAESREDDIEPIDVISWLCERLSRFTEDMLVSETGPPLAYRGALAYGEFIVEDRFILGRAIDEAAEAEKLAEGAFAWLCPSALKAAGGLVVASTIAYPVPLKGGQVFTTRVIPPVFNLSNGRAHTLARLAAAFRLDDSSLAEHIKYLNTLPMVLEALDRNAEEDG